MMEGNSNSDEFISDQMKITIASDGDEPTDEYLETSSVSSSESESCTFDDEMDTDMWSPPEPQDFEDDICSVTNFEDEDDEFADAEILSDSCHMTAFGEEESESYRFKEEKRKVLEKMMNEEFKAFVAQLLKFFDMSTLGRDGESWVDIVTSLAWKAAAFVKVDALEEKARSLDHYVKITCVACGTRSQSQLVKGLVFKKHAVHKNMRTEFKNPRLLLVRGLLGQLSTGLISFDTVLSHSGKNHPLMTLVQLLATSCANVILVEKAVSRDLVEFILHCGHMTIVSNMKLHRLERVARCTGSSISSADTILSQNPRQCNGIVFQKIVEEHAHVKEGGRRPCKTFMFIQGCPTRLGCTILLKGSHTEELKKIKRVVRAAVFKAYHLIREISFRMDLNAMFSTYAVLPDHRQIYVVSHSASFKQVMVGTSSSDLTCDGKDGTGSSDLTSRASCRNSKVVLITILNFSRGIVCDHGKCLHTNFMLAMYLRDNLLNQNLKCKTCREQAEAHIYYYSHNHQQLAVRVQQLPLDKHLARAGEQKVWFWSRCAKCKLDNEDLNSTKRVLISNYALGLPFGRFLELHFSKPSPFDVSSICGHSPHRDFLLFVGSGSMVAVFKYSPMITSEIFGANGASIGEFAKIEILPLLGMLMSCCEHKHPRS